MNRTNRPVHSKPSGSIWFYFFQHQSDTILEDIKPPSPNPPSPNRSCRPPPTHRDRLLASAISPCKISLHRSLQDHHCLSRVFPATLLQAAKPPPGVGNPTINPLWLVVSPHSATVTSPTVAASLQHGKVEIKVWYYYLTPLCLLSSLIVSSQMESCTGYFRVGN